MADRRSALAHLPAGPAGEDGLTLRDTMPGSILQIQAWPETLAIVRSAISELAGVSSPEMGRAVSAEGIIVAATAPGRFLLSGDAEDLAERFAAALPSAEGAVTDLSHGRTILRLDGNDAAGLLARVVTLDLDSSVFPPGRVAQTAIHHIDVLLHRRSEASFDLWVLRSFAEALADGCSIRDWRAKSYGSGSASSCPP